MNYVRAIFLSITLACCVAVEAFDIMELKNADVIAEGQCNLMGHMLGCVLVNNELGNFIVVVDNLGPLVVYVVNEIKEGYTDEETVIIWIRGNQKNDV